jgi:hypothetical protein
LVKDERLAGNLNERFRDITPESAQPCSATPGEDRDGKEFRHASVVRSSTNDSVV